MGDTDFLVMFANLSQAVKLQNNIGRNQERLGEPIYQLKFAIKWQKKRFTFQHGLYS